MIFLFAYIYMWFILILLATVLGLSLVIGFIPELITGLILYKILRRVVYSR